MKKILLTILIVLGLIKMSFAGVDYHGDDVGIADSITIGHDITVGRNLTAGNHLSVGNNLYVGDTAEIKSLSMTGSIKVDDLTSYGVLFLNNDISMCGTKTIKFSVGQGYDSGLFAAANSQRYTLKHNLGARNLNITLLYASHTSGASTQVIDSDSTGAYGAVVADVNTTTCTVYTGDSSITSPCGNNFGDGTSDLALTTSGYLRVIMLRVALKDL